MGHSWASQLTQLGLAKSALARRLAGLFTFAGNCKRASHLDGLLWLLLEESQHINSTESEDHGTFFARVVVRRQKRAESALPSRRGFPSPVRLVSPQKQDIFLHYQTHILAWQGYNCFSLGSKRTYRSCLVLGHNLAGLSLASVAATKVWMRNWAIILLYDRWAIWIVKCGWEIEP
jgi:hypothetical protein